MIRLKGIFLITFLYHKTKCHSVRYKYRCTCKFVTIKSHGSCRELRSS